MSTPIIGLSPKQPDRTAMYAAVGFIFVLILVGGYFWLRKPSTPSPSPASTTTYEEEEEEEEEEEVRPPESPTSTNNRVNAESCKSFVDAKICPGPSMTPASAESCKSFVDAKTCPPASAASCKSFTDLYKPEAYYSDKWCKSTYANLSVDSTTCKLEKAYYSALKSAVAKHFSRADVYYIFTVSTTVSGSSTTTSKNYYMTNPPAKTPSSVTVMSKNISPDTPAIAGLMSTAATEYKLPPETQTSVWSNSTVQAATRLAFPKFGSDMDGVTYTLRSATKTGEVARQVLWDEPVLAILDAMEDTNNWIMIGKEGTNTYYKLDANKLAEAVYNISKTNTNSVLNKACVF